MSGPARRLEVALELADLAVELVEARVRRENPQLSDREVAAVVLRWQRTRPGAEHGDALGVPTCWPRLRDPLP